MKTIKDYINDGLSSDDDEKVTRQLFQKHFGSENAEREKRWANIVTAKYDIQRNTPHPTADNGRRYWLYTTLAVAASILAWIFIVVPEATQLTFDQQLHAYVTDWEPDGNGRKSILESTEVNEVDARAAYNDGNFEVAAGLWKALAARYPEKAEYQLLYARSIFYQQVPDYEQAILLFEQVIANSNRFDQEARWYLALALLKQERIVAAQKQLEYIVAQGDWKKKEAAILLKYLQ